MTLLLPGIYFYKLHWAVTYGSAITNKFETWSVFFQRYRFKLLWLENYCSSWTNKHHVLALHQNITSSKQRDEKAEGCNMRIQSWYNFDGNSAIICSNSTIEALQKKMWIYSKLTMKTPERRRWHLLVFLLLIWNIFDTFF